ncbi:MAG: rod shape-determining protein MreD [Phycisphaerales bacterium]|jgi:rod shape-determining protein MreD|nr:rod shape-determining protein MreD [Phycisphaerales bacterium]
MRWFAVLILAYLSIAVQSGMEGVVRWWGGGPNLALLAAVFIAVNAPRDAALLGCFVIGLMQDLVSQQPLGLFAVSYGLMGWIVNAMGQVVYRAHPLTHVALALLGSAVTVMMILLAGWLHPPTAAGVSAGGAVLPAVRVPMGGLLSGAVWTAILAPIVLGILHRLRKWFAFESTRRKLRVY